MNITELMGGLSKEFEGMKLEVQGLAYDSRDVKVGYVFVARRGASRYVDEAIKNGAVFLVLEEALPVSVPNIIVEDARKSLAILAQ